MPRLTIEEAAALGLLTPDQLASVNYNPFTPRAGATWSPNLNLRPGLSSSSFFRYPGLSWRSGINPLRFGIGGLGQGLTLSPESPALGLGGIAAPVGRVASRNVGRGVAGGIAGGIAGVGAEGSVNRTRVMVLPDGRRLVTYADGRQVILPSPGTGGRPVQAESQEGQQILAAMGLVRQGVGLSQQAARILEASSGGEPVAAGEAPILPIAEAEPGAALTPAQQEAALGELGINTALPPAGTITAAGTGRPMLSPDQAFELENAGVPLNRAVDISVPDLTLRSLDLAGKPALMPDRADALGAYRDLLLGPGAGGIVPPDAAGKIGPSGAGDLGDLTLSPAFYAPGGGSAADVLLASRNRYNFGQTPEDILATLPAPAVGMGRGRDLDPRGLGVQPAPGDIYEPELPPQPDAGMNLTPSNTLGALQSLLGLGQGVMAQDPMSIVRGLVGSGMSVADIAKIPELGRYLSAAGAPVNLVQAALRGDVPGAVAAAPGLINSFRTLSPEAFNAVARALNVAPGTLSALGGLGGVLGGGYGLYNAIDRGDPLGAVMSAGQLYSSGAPLVNYFTGSNLPTMSGILESALTSLAPEYAASIGLGPIGAVTGGGAVGAQLAGAGAASAADALMGGTAPIVAGTTGGATLGSVTGGAVGGTLGGVGVGTAVGGALGLLAPVIAWGLNTLNYVDPGSWGRIGKIATTLATRAQSGLKMGNQMIDELRDNKVTDLNVLAQALVKGSELLMPVYTALPHPHGGTLDAGTYISKTGEANVAKYQADTQKMIQGLSDIAGYMLSRGVPPQAIGALWSPTISASARTGQPGGYQVDQNAPLPEGWVGMQTGLNRQIGVNPSSYGADQGEISASPETVESIYGGPIWTMFAALKGVNPDYSIKLGAKEWAGTDLRGTEAKTQKVNIGRAEPLAQYTEAERERMAQFNPEAQAQLFPGAPDIARNTLYSYQDLSLGGPGGAGANFADTNTARGLFPTYDPRAINLPTGPQMSNEQLMAYFAKNPATPAAATPAGDTVNFDPLKFLSNLQSGQRVDVRAGQETLSFVPYKPDQSAMFQAKDAGYQPFGDGFYARPSGSGQGVEVYVPQDRPQDLGKALASLTSSASSADVAAALAGAQAPPSGQEGVTPGAGPAADIAPEPVAGGTASQTPQSSGGATSTTADTNQPVPGSGGFKFGGTVPASGQYLVHKGEEIVPAAEAMHRLTDEAGGQIAQAFSARGFSRGGRVPETGRYALHKGEVVVPPGKTVEDVDQNGPTPDVLDTMRKGGDLRLGGEEDRQLKMPKMSPGRLERGFGPGPDGGSNPDDEARIPAGVRLAHHEQSETVQDDSGRWVNVYGRNTDKAGQPLPYKGNSYATVDEAVKAAKQRSEDEGRRMEQRQREDRMLEDIDKGVSRPSTLGGASKEQRKYLTPDDIMRRPAGPRAEAAPERWYVNLKEGVPSQELDGTDPQVRRLAFTPEDVQDALDNGEAPIMVGRGVLKAPPSLLFNVLKKAQATQNSDPMKSPAVVAMGGRLRGRPSGNLQPEGDTLPGITGRPAPGPGPRFQGDRGRAADTPLDRVPFAPEYTQPNGTAVEGPTPRVPGTRDRMPAIPAAPMGANPFMVNTPFARAMRVAQAQLPPGGGQPMDRFLEQIDRGQIAPSTLGGAIRQQHQNLTPGAIMNQPGPGTIPPQPQTPGGSLYDAIRRLRG